MEKMNSDPVSGTPDYASDFKQLKKVHFAGSRESFDEGIEETGSHNEEEKTRARRIGRKPVELYRKIFSKGDNKVKKFFREIFGGDFGKSKKETQVSTIDDIARKKGYHKDENLGWVDENGDRKAGFELDEKYPEVAGMYESSVKKYFGKFDKVDINHVLHNVSGKLLCDDERIILPCKKKILDNIELFQIMGEGNWDDLNSIASRCGSKYYEAYCDLFGKAREGEPYFMKELERNQKRRQILDRIFDGVGDVDDERQSFLEYHIAPSVMKFFSDEAEKPGFCEAISDFVRNSDDSGNWDNLYKVDFASGLEGIMENGGGEYAGDYVDLFSLFDNKKRIDHKRDLLKHFVKDHGIKKTTKDAMTKIFDLMDQDDEEVRGIGDDYANTREGFFNVEAYTVECFSVVSSPREIDRLVRIHNEIPTTDFAKRERNRIDAMKIERKIISDRTFIHEEYPGVHEVVSAMVDFYDAPDSEKDDKKRVIEKLKNKYNLRSMVGEIPTDISELETRDDLDGKKEKVIDVLRRLKENTDPVSIDVPTTKFPELNQALEKISPLLNEKTGELKVSVEEVGDAISVMNGILNEGNGELGVFPSTVSAVAFLDKMAAYALRGIDKKDWRELVFDPKFKEIVRFSQMTSSLNYNEDEFEGFYNRFGRKSGEAFFDDNVDDEKIEEGYRILSSRIMENVRGLGAIYAANEKTKRFSGAVWSGNLAHELIGLYEKY